MSNKGVWRLNALLRQKYGNNINQIDNFKGFNLEPLEMLRDWLRENVTLVGNEAYLHSIGGATQIIKIYQHNNAKPIGVFWPNKTEGKPNLLGNYWEEIKN